MSYFRNLRRLPVKIGNLGNQSRVRTFCSGNHYSDREIDESYNLTKKIERLGTLFTKDGTEKFDAMRKNKVGLGSSFTRNLGLFIEMNHPLLEKYDFDAVEFLTGAEHAYMKVSEIIYSKGFYDYATGVTTSSEEANFLRDVCTQDAWEYYIDFAKNNYGSTPSVKITAERFTAFNASLYKANVVVIDEDTPGAMDNDEDGLKQSQSFFGSPPPGLGMAAAGNVEGADRGGGDGGSVKSAEQDGKVPHFGDSLDPEEPVEHIDSEEQKRENCVVGLMDVNFFTDVMSEEELKWSKITQWRLLGYLSERDNLEWKIASCTPIWPPF